MVTGSCLSHLNHPTRACCDSVECSSTGTPGMQQAKAASTCLGGAKAEIKQQQQAPPLSINQKLPCSSFKSSLHRQTLSIRLLISALLRGVQLFSWAQKRVQQRSPLRQKSPEQAQHEKHCLPACLPAWRLISPQHSLEFGTSDIRVFSPWGRREDSCTAGVRSAQKNGLKNPMGKSSILFLCWHQAVLACLFWWPWNTAPHCCCAGASVDNRKEQGRLRKTFTSLILRNIKSLSAKVKSSDGKRMIHKKVTGNLSYSFQSWLATFPSSSELLTQHTEHETHRRRLLPLLSSFPIYVFHE